MKGWFQRHDFSSEDFDCPSAAFAGQRFRSFDWAAERVREKEAEAKGEEWCPSGMGLIDKQEQLLHICPQDGEAATVYYHYRISKTILGFLKSHAKQEVCNESFPLAKMPELIEAHFAGHQDVVLRLLQR